MDVFRRKELKFLVNAQQRQRIEEVLRSKMIPDSHGHNTICNLYYDTPDYRLIRRSLERPVYKEKMRLRSYGIVKPGTDIYLELKKKYQGIVYKRRISATQAQAEAFIESREPMFQDSQIGREMAYFRDYYRDLSPKMYLCYEREAWYDPNDGGFRMTLDCNVRYRTTDLDLSAPAGGRELLPWDMSLMEVKAEGAIPMWLTELLSELHLHKQSFSKYGRAYEQLLAERLEKERKCNYA